MKTTPNQHPKPRPKRQRRPENGLLTISLPKSLKAAIEQAAREDQRSVSNFLVHRLTQILDAQTAASLNEDPTRYRTD